VLTMGERPAGPSIPPTPRRPTEPGPPARRAYPAARDAYGGATAALLGLTVASALGLLRVFTGHRWLGPVLVMAAGVHTVCWAARRARLPQLVALFLGLAAVWVLASWTVLGSATAYGLPAGRTAVQLWTSLHQARIDFASAITPTVPDRGFTLTAALGTGLVALLGDWGAFRLRSALYGAVPAFAFFVVCCTVGAGPGRQWAVAVEVAALLIFLLAHGASVGRTDQAWFGNRRSGSSRWAMKAGGVAAGAALVAAVAVTPLLGSSEGRGVFGWRGGFGSAGSGPRQVPNPVVDLHTRLVMESDVPVFTVESSVASYWRLTSLDTFTGQDWISTNSYRSFGQRLPGSQAVPPGTRIVHQQFSIEQLDSVWLPDAFTPVAVTGVSNVSFDPSSGSLITSHATSDGLTYSVDSYQYLSTLNEAQLQAAPSVSITNSLRRYLELPSSVPADVYALARSITAGKTTEYAKAVALQSFFLGPAFTYSLNPPDDGYGIDALTNFLFDTRTGFCQQFAGAYAVLARAIGLPTRLAVGFATGTAIGPGSYQVLNADAHTWPEVYFGPRFGWLPFEPTKSFVDPLSGGYAPPVSTGAGAGATAPDESPLPTKQSPSPGNTGSAAPGHAVPTNPPNGAQAATGSSHHGGTPAWVVILLLVSGLLVWAGGVAANRRLRWYWRRWRVRDDPGALVLSHWADVHELLGWWGARRAPGETDKEFATRAAGVLGRRLREPAPWLPGGVQRLAGLATEAAFAPIVPPRRAQEAGLVAREIHHRLFRSATGRQLLLWVLNPRPRRQEPG
jgi:transglutaminase-like putative cysteine protease